MWDFLIDYFEVEWQAAERQLFRYKLNVTNIMYGEEQLMAEQGIKNGAAAQAQQPVKLTNFSNNIY